MNQKEEIKKRIEALHVKYSPAFDIWSRTNEDNDMMREHYKVLKKFIDGKIPIRDLETLELFANCLKSGFREEKYFKSAPMIEFPRIATSQNSTITNTSEPLMKKHDDREHNQVTNVPTRETFNNIAIKEEICETGVDDNPIEKVPTRCNTRSKTIDERNSKFLRRSSRLRKKDMPKYFESCSDTSSNKSTTSSNFELSGSEENLDKVPITKSKSKTRIGGCKKEKENLLKKRRMTMLL